MPDPRPAVSCETCVAACCRAPLYLQMSRDEYAAHHEVMDLEVVVEIKPFTQRASAEAQRHGWRSVAGGSGVFKLNHDCGYLDDANRCSIHAMRPRSCREFEVGSDECLRRRREVGLDRPTVDPSTGAEAFLESPSDLNDAFVVRIRRPSD